MLQDLDELVLKCRDERARAYIREAVLCFKASAFRSAIVATWIAVAFDILDKIYELSLSGDSQAAAFVTDYANALQQSDIKKLQEIEAALLDTAKDKFELISGQEFLDLQRLKEDRNRCAHPSRPSITEVFTPSAELARLHIRSAVESLLQHEPAQGKAALAELQRLIKLSHFPTERKLALPILQASPLRRARPVLIRNLMIACLKAALDTKTDPSLAVRIRTAVLCIKDMHHQEWLKVVGDELARLMDGVNDVEHLVRAVDLLAIDNDLSRALPESKLILLRQLLLSDLGAYTYIADTALSVPELAGAAEASIGKMSREGIEDIRMFSLSPTISRPVVARIVRGYAEATDFEEGNAWSGLLHDIEGALTEEDVRTLLHAAATNGQLFRNFKTPRVIKRLRALNKLPEQEFLELDAEIPPSG